MELGGDAVGRLNAAPVGRGERRIGARHLREKGLDVSFPESDRSSSVRERSARHATRLQPRRHAPRGTVVRPRMDEAARHATSLAGHLTWFAPRPDPTHGKQAARARGCVTHRLDGPEGPPRRAAHAAHRASGSSSQQTRQANRSSRAIPQEAVGLAGLVRKERGEAFYNDLHEESTRMVDGELPGTVSREAPAGNRRAGRNKR